MNNQNKITDITNIVDFTGLKIALASPARIREWSHGEVTKPETINYRTLKAEKDGLFSENIFGPTKDWECYCGKYKRIRYKGIICDKCGVEVTQSKVRRERMGHIELCVPVTHVWYLRGATAKIPLLIGVSAKDLENVVYFSAFLVESVNEEEKVKALEKLELDYQKKVEEFDKQLKEKCAKIVQETEEAVSKLKQNTKNLGTFAIQKEELELKSREKQQSESNEMLRDRQRTEEIYKAIRDKIKGIKNHSVLSEDEYLKIEEYAGVRFMEVGIGAECVLRLLEKINVGKLIFELRKESEKSVGIKNIKILKRLRLAEGFRKSQINPSWMILKNLPIIPPDLRPMVQLIGGRFATSDLNDLYRRVINRNNRLKHLLELGAPEIILRNEKRMLQEAVDSLIDVTQRSNARVLPQSQQLKSLSDMLRGKQGRFRQNLLGKRVDYSGRSVIVVGPELKLNQCGLPKDMALEMFKPFVLRELIMRGIAPNVKNAKHILDKRTPEVFDILEDITKKHPVLLNRAPTLHKLGIQAFYPVLIEGMAIKLHPCVCAGYNADFDGDQMAVHVPLSKKAQEEAIKLMMPVNNLLKPADGTPITVPNKEIALGCYYLTTIKLDDGKEKEKYFSGEQEAITAYQLNKIILREEINVVIDKKIIKTTVGRIIFNEVLPLNMRFINEPIKQGTIKSLINKALKHYPHEEVADLIDKMKKLGFYYATHCGGFSVSLFDNIIIPEKDKFIGEAEERIRDLENNFKTGLITQSEKKRLSNEIWLETTEKIARLTQDSLPLDNSVRMVIESGGARASLDQIKQLSAIRGLIVDPLGKIVDLPIKSNYRQGLSLFEYTASTRGSRKGLTDSALKTADAGYLTRRLVDTAHDVIIRLQDCGNETDGWEIRHDEKRETSFANRVLGRITLEKIIDPQTKKIIVNSGELIDEEKMDLIIKAKVKRVVMRSPITCKAKYGMCQKCYGWDFSTRKLVEIGVPVGVIAAQSIGEPGTQLTMKVRHTGGIVGLDVTQGLPRVEELLEMRTPKVLSPISEIGGKVEIIEVDGSTKIRVNEEKEYLIPKLSELKVADGDLIAAGTQLASGFIDVRDVLEIKGLQEAQKYLITEVQAVYESQGVPINDKHFEVIVRKMSDKVMIETVGDTSLLPGELTEKTIFEKENAAIMAEGGEPATARVIVLGLTPASLHTSSWLSAASFQETTNVLAAAAVEGDTDRLIGLKENVIIGRLIPVSEDRVTVED